MVVVLSLGVCCFRYAANNGAVDLNLEQTQEGIEHDFVYPALTYEYYEAILNNTTPWDKIWIVTGFPTVGDWAHHHHHDRV